MVNNTNQIKIMALMRYTFKAFTAIALTCFMSHVAISAASGRIISRVDYSGAIYEETVTDMQVKVLGGYVSLKRKYNKDGWTLNSNWQNLTFKDPANRSVRYVSASGSSGSDTSSEIVVRPGDPEPVIRTIMRGRFEYKPVSSQEPDRYVDEYNPSLQIVRTETGYRWSNKQGDWIDYSATGATKAYANKNGVSVNFVRDANGRITTVNDHSGNSVLTYDYSTDGRLVVTDYEGRTVKYHGHFPFIDKVTDVRGNDWLYTYQSIKGQLYLSSKTDPQGRKTVIGHELVPGGLQTINIGTDSVWTIEEITDPVTGEVTVRESYNSSGSGLVARSYMVPAKVMYTHMIYADGGRVDYRYFYNQNTKTYSLVEKNSDGIVSDKWYALDGKLKRYSVGGKILFTRAEASNGSQAVKTDIKGRKTNFNYNQWEKISSIVHPDGTSASYSYHPKFAFITGFTDEDGHKTAGEYDDFGNLTKITRAAGTANQRVTEFEYDEYGQVTVIRQVGDEHTQTSITEFSYDTKGNVTQVKDPEGFITKYQDYNALGLPKKVIDTRQKTWEFSYDAAGNITQQKSPLGFVTSLTYDKVDNLKSLTDPELNITQFGYDARDRLVTLTNPLEDSFTLNYSLDGRPLSAINEEGHQANFTYDRQRRLKKVVDAEGLATDFNYEDEDKSALARLDSILTPNGKLKFSLDERGRVVSQTTANADDSIALATQFEYNKRNLTTKVTDAENNNSTYEYNAHNELVKVTNALGHITRFEYDRRGNLTKVIDPKQSATTYQYDRRNLLKVETKPMGQTMSYEYDGEANLLSVIDSKNQVMVFTYDDDGRLTKEEHKTTVSATTTEKTVTYNYNKNGYLTAYNDGTTSATYTLDKLSRLQSSTINYGSFSKRFSYEYAKDQQVASFTNAEGIKSSYRYDKANRLSLIQIAGQGSIAYTEYEGYLPKKIVYPGGVNVTNSYDGIGRLLQEAVKDPAGNSLQATHYHYDKVGNVINKTTSLGAFAYEYDAIYRLTKADQLAPLQNRIYQYDEVGNRTSTEVAGQSWQYNANHELLSYGTTSEQTRFDYDANGSTVTKTTTMDGGSAGNAGAVTSPTSTGTETYQYDVANRLREVRRNGDLVASYYYDPFGKRLSKTVNGETTYFLYANEGLIGEYDGTGALKQSYQYLPDALWGTAQLGMIKGGEAYFYQHDQIGTPNLLTSKTGQVKWKGTVDAYGQMHTQISTIDSPLRFAGQYFDSETGYHQNYHRDYNPSTGRYLQSDPIGLAGGINIYGYVHQNPIMLTDPTGQFACGGVCIAAIAGGIMAGLDYLYQTQVEGKSNECVNWWEVGAWGLSGTGIGIVARSALFHGGLGTAIRRFFWDPRKWNQVGRKYWDARGGAGMSSIDHYIFAHASAVYRGGSLPAGLVNAGFNLVRMPIAMNSYLGGIGVSGGMGSQILLNTARFGASAFVGLTALTGAAGGYMVGTLAQEDNSSCECSQ